MAFRPARCWRARALPQYTKLKTVRISRFRCGEAEATALAEALASRPGIEQLQIRGEGSGWSLAQDGIVMVKALLAMAATMITTLTSIDLSGNAIGAEGAKVLAPVLKANVSLRDLDLSGNLIHNDGAQALSEALRGKSSLRNISLGSNWMGDEGAQALLEVIKVSTTLRKMDLSNNPMGQEMKEAVAEALNRISSESDNQIQPESIAHDVKVARCRSFEAPVRFQALVEALRANTSVTKIFQTDSDIGGPQVLAEALKTNNSVTEITFNGDKKIGDDGAKALAEALKVNTSIISITLARNDIGDDGAKALAESLKDNRKVRGIGLLGNKIGDDGAKALAEALKVNSSVTAIFLAENHLAMMERRL